MVEAQSGKAFQDIITSLGGDKAKADLTGDEVDPDEFAADVKKLKLRMRRENSWLLRPRGTFVQYWDLISSIALLYTLIVTPFEVGLDLPTQLDALFVLNQFVSCIFICDITVQFFLPVPDNRLGEGVFERRHAYLAKRYICSWFALDVITILPFDILVLARALSGPFKGTKLLRIMRLLKLLKVLRSSAIIERWQSSFSISTSSVQFFIVSFSSLVLIHWFSCFWCLMITIQGSQRPMADTPEAILWEDTMMDRMDAPTLRGNECTACFYGDTSNATMALCNSPCLTECEREHVASMMNVSPLFVYNSEIWVCRAVEGGFITPHALTKGQNAGDIYIASLLVSMLQMVGGVSTILPTSTPEYFFFFVAILAGTVLFAVVQGVICGMATTGDPDEIAWRQKYDALNFMMADNKLPRWQCREVRVFFRKSRNLFKRRSYGGLIDDCLSPELQDDVRYLISQRLFEHVWYLRACDREFLEDVAVHIVRRAYAPREEVDAVCHLNILTMGLATRGGSMLSAGAHFGDIILTSVALRDTRPARTLLYCEVARLNRDDLYITTQMHPEAHAIIRQASIKLALNRAMIILSLNVRKRNEKLETLEVAASKRLPAIAEAAAAGASLTEVESPPAVVVARRPSEEVKVDAELKEMHSVLGTEWRELEYDPDGQPVSIARGTSTLGPEADRVLQDLSSAAPKEQPVLLAKMLLEQSARLDSLMQTVSKLVDAKKAPMTLLSPEARRPPPQAPSGLAALLSTRLSA